MATLCNISAFDFIHTNILAFQLESIEDNDNTLQTQMMTMEMLRSKLMKITELLPTIYLDTSAVSSGNTIAQVFVAVESLVVNIHAIKTNHQFINTHEDKVWTWGAPNKLISDRAQVKFRNQVKEILCAYCIDDWQSETHYQHQDFAECKSSS